MLKYLVALVLLLAGIVAFAYLHIGTSTYAAAEVADISVQKPSIAIAGMRLARVEVWAIPAGTGVSEDQYQLLGEASLASTSPDSVQHWLFPIPAQPLLVTEIFARGYSQDGKMAGQRSLPQIGATDLYAALWGSASSTSGTVVATTTEVTIGPGQTGIIGGLSITFNSFVQDSRCPIDVQCIQAGAVTVNVTLSAGGQSEVRNFPSDEVPYSFGSYKIFIENIAPPRRSKTEIPPAEYRITFRAVQG